MYVYTLCMNMLVVVAIVGSVITWFIDPMLFGGYSIGLMVCSAISVILHRRELRRIQREGMQYLDYLLGDD